MAAGVSSLLRILSKEKGEGKRGDLVTRDLLGGCGAALGSPSEVSDLHRQLPSGWQRRRLHDLNLPPPSLDIGLVTVPPASYQSVCTLDKVKSALERAARESSSKKRRSEAGSAASPSSSSLTPSSVMRRGSGEDGDEEGSDMSSSSTSGAGVMMAAGCPCCLLYVLISKTNPRCPRCGSHVPVPHFTKKPRIDLNSTQQIFI